MYWRCRRTRERRGVGHKKTGPTWNPVLKPLLEEGLEPSRLTAPEPKSGVSANFTTRAEKSNMYVASLDHDVNSAGW